MSGFGLSSNEVDTVRQMIKEFKARNASGSYVLPPRGSDRTGLFTPTNGPTRVATIDECEAQYARMDAMEESSNLRNGGLPA